MKLYLVRHGETIENKKRIMQGQMPGKLTKKGIQQAKKLANRLKDEEFNIIYSSDLARATDTAKEIAKYHKDIPLKFVKQLRERNQGSAEGLKFGDIDWEDAKHTQEKLSSVRKRAKSLLDRVYKKYKGQTVLFVGHGAINRAIMAVIHNKPATYIREAPSIPNTSLSIFEIREDKKHKVLLLSCIKHLEEIK